jgi:hypothetical protein
MAIRADHLCTLAQIETVLGVNASEVAKREQAIDSATSGVLEWLGRRYVHNPGLFTVLTQLFDIEEGEDNIFLDEWPLTSVTSVTEDETVLTVDDDYFIYVDEGRIERIDSNWVKGRRSVQVIHKPGYTDLDSVPKSINQACIEWTIYLLQHQQSSGLREASISLKRNIFESGFPTAHIKALLAPYRSLQAYGL